MPLSDVSGQERACESLLRALNSQRLHHAYLFAGPEGIGKALAARSVAQAMLCTESRPNGDGCGQCNVCLRVQAGQHADVHIVQRKTSSDGRVERQIKIDQIRALQKALSYKAFEGHRRVVLVLEADKMTPSTANAMLKTLEEPGRATHFILVSDAAHRLLPTIISRCQRVNFAPLDISFVETSLVEKTGLSSSQASIVARLAQGSIGRGLAMADVDIFELRDRLLGALYQSSKPPIDELLDLAEELARPDRRDLLPMSFHILRTWHRDLLVVQTNAREASLVHDDLSVRLQEIAGAQTVELISKKITRINDAQSAIFERMANARLVLEALMIQLSSNELE